MAKSNSSLIGSVLAIVVIYFGVKSLTGHHDQADSKVPGSPKTQVAAPPPPPVDLTAIKAYYGSEPDVFGWGKWKTVSIELHSPTQIRVQLDVPSAQFREISERDSPGQLTAVANACPRKMDPMMQDLQSRGIDVMVQGSVNGEVFADASCKLFGP